MEYFQIVCMHEVSEVIVYLPGYLHLHRGNREWSLNAMRYPGNAWVVSAWLCPVRTFIFISMALGFVTPFDELTTF